MKSNFENPEAFVAFINSKFKERAQHKFHWLKQGVLCTAQLTGMPSARMVVIREVSDSLVLEIHTDSRSNKVLDLQINPKTEILFYDPITQTQLKCYGKALVITAGEAVEKAWSKVPELSRKQYTTLLAPGTIIEKSEDLSYRPLRHFCIIKIDVIGIEYLQLGDPHKRIRWVNKEGSCVLENLVP